MLGAIIGFNTMAIEAMQRGRHIESKNLLLQALHGLRSMQAMQENNGGCVGLLFGRLSISSVAISMTPMRTANSDIFFIFDRALAIAHDSQIGDASDCCIPKIATAVLYNMGLTLQLFAAETGTTSYLKKAADFYMNAMAAARIAALNNEDVLIVLALVNNMGCVFLKLVDYQGASNCLTMLSDFYEAADASSILNDEDATFFFFTCFVFPKWQIIAAPMA